MPTRIDFHSSVPDKVAYGCRLVRKARAQTGTPRILLLAENQQQLAQLDDALWTFSDLDFLPHVLLNSPLATHTPVLLSTTEEHPFDEMLMLINLSQRLVQNPARFVRIFEIVSRQEEDLLLGRQRYRSYASMGAQLTHHIAN